MKKIDSKTARRGQALGFLGVLGFSLTLPATRMAVSSIDATVVGLGRALIAALLAAIVLSIKRPALPNKAQWASLCIVAFGVVFGFPFFSTWAMQHVPATHGAVVLGVLPMVTALFGRLRSNEAPSRAFWLASAGGTAVVIIFALKSGSGSFQAADWALLAAILLAGMGYAEGGRLAREIGGWQVICWALLIATPLLLLPVGRALWLHGFAPTPASLLGFAYVSVISMFLCFFAWYEGLALGGVARVSQLQLLQPFLTLGFSALLLHEHIQGSDAISALLVALSITISRRAPVRSVASSGNKPL